MASTSRTRLQAARAERSRQTRGRVIVAATELFVRDGYLQTTMSDIARQAGVAVQTLYLAFGSKVAVLSAALDVAIVGDDEPVPVLQRPWMVALRNEPDGPTALGVFVDAAGRIIERIYPLYAVTRDASADPELADVLRRNKELRFVVHREVAAHLVSKPGFGSSVRADRTADTIYALMSQETYGLLVVERGWSRSDWSAWVERHLFTHLSGPDVR
jgi:AcrR family transcriptional regulator